MGAAEMFARSPVSPAIELGAYEELWAKEGVSFKSLAELFGKSSNDLPSCFVDVDVALTRGREVLAIFEAKKLSDVGYVVHGTVDYPQSLRSAKYPVQFLYYRGNLDLVSAPARVAIVGSREASEDGLKRARSLAKKLADDGVVVVSGLAKGIDTAAHTAAIDAGGQTIGVIGTPLNEAYPKENAQLQEHIAQQYLLVSQVPVLRYAMQSYRGNRLFFPERNATMSALTQATVIVEAGETSGSLTQAQAAIYQERKLFIMENCFQRGLKWPERFLAQGAIRVSSYDEIKSHLDLPAH